MDKKPKEKDVPGNAAAMREALLRCDAIAQLPEVRDFQSVKDARNIIAAALSAPPRNCDRFESWADALRVYLAEHPKMADMNQRAIDACCNMWLFNQAKKGESK